MPDRRGRYIADRAYVADLGFLLLPVSLVTGYERIGLLASAALVLVGSFPPVVPVVRRWQAAAGAILLASGLFTGTAQAETSPSDVPAGYVAGIGAKSCADWLKIATGKQARLDAQRWLEGFVSMMDYEAGATWGQGVPVGEMLDRVDAYCRKNSDKRFVDGAAEMANKLIHPS